MDVLTQQIQLPILQHKSVALFLKREDLIHPTIPGNKFRKLKYNIKEASENNFDTLLTFGGAFSNHILATAAVGKENGFKAIGIIRGEELAVKWEENPTLLKAAHMGMRLEFISRTDYRKKEKPEFLEELKNTYGRCYVLPEGGTNALAIKGCEEILTPHDSIMDVICCSVGTGGTIAGICNTALPHQRVLGFPALKGDFLKKDICKFTDKENWSIQTNYHFGGYGKVKKELIEFINWFNELTGIPLDPIYTAKMLFGILDMVTKDYFEPGTKIMAIHTGGLQGISGMNLNLELKNLPLIKE